MRGEHDAIDGAILAGEPRMVSAVWKGSGLDAGEVLASIPGARLVHRSTALCPTCLAELPCVVYADADDVVWMTRTCPEHGRLDTRVWPSLEHYEWLRSEAFPKTKPTNVERIVDACPKGCGTCARHERRGTLLEIEVTRNCNLHCPVCFASAEGGEDDPSLDEIESMYRAIARSVGTDGAVQITGGEPTCRKDLKDIVYLGRQMGFWGIEVNTNGLVIANSPGYLEDLVGAGVTGIYLSFDGVTGGVYEATCGRDILDTKLRAIERCREVGIQVVLSVAVVAGLNDGQLGDLLRFALANSDVVAGLALQPAFTSGRFDAERAMPMSAGDVILGLVEQSDGLLETRDIWPLGCSNPLCDTGVFLVKGDDAEHPSGFYPATRRMTPAEYHAGYSPDSPQGSVFLDILYKKGYEVGSGLSVIIMNYMDAVSMDTQRLRECSMMVAVPDGRALPFCAYHLTDSAGKRIYAPWCKEAHHG